MDRMYSVLKQSTDQDPKGVFIKKYVPELQNVPLTYLHEPWKMPKCVQKRVGCTIGVDYPKPVVNEKETYKAARAKMTEFNRRAKGSTEVETLIAKHASKAR